MDPSFWHSRWNAGHIGFHEGAPNAHLTDHAARLGTGRRVLVPLCGKTEDLAFLAARGHQVVGVELVESAVRAFFEEHQATPTVTRVGPFGRHAAENVTVLVGDFFATTRESLGPVDALYDRAALVALPPAMRTAYVGHLRTLMPPGAPGLVVTMEYPQAKMSGPPFSVPEAEVRARYAGLSLERLAEVRAEGARFSEIGAVEKCFAVRF